MLQAGGDLQDVTDRLAHRQPASASSEDAQVVALDKLEGDEVQPLVLAAEEDPRDVLVVEPGGGLRLLVEAAHVLRVGRHLRRQDLQRDLAFELHVARPQHRRHAADADRLDQLEMGEPPAAQAVAEALRAGASLAEVGDIVGRRRRLRIDGGRPLGNNRRCIVGRLGVNRENRGVAVVDAQRRIGFTVVAAGHGFLCLRPRPRSTSRAMLAAHNLVGDQCLGELARTTPSTRSAANGIRVGGNLSAPVGPLDMTRGERRPNQVFVQLLYRQCRSDVNQLSEFGEDRRTSVLEDLLKSVDLGTYYSFHELAQNRKALHDAMQLGDWLGSYVGVGLLMLLTLTLLLVQGRIQPALVTVCAFIVGVAGVEMLRCAVPAQRPVVVAATVGDDEMLRSFPRARCLPLHLRARCWCLRPGIRFGAGGRDGCWRRASRC